MEQTESSAAGASRTGSAEDEPPQPPSDDAGARGISIQLDITDTTERLNERARAWLERFGAMAITGAVGETAGPHTVALSIVDDETMAALHLTHSRIEGATDVLTFDLRDDDSGSLDVEIVVCLDEAQRQARRQSEIEGGVERELLLYLLHGVLHCLGFDDHDQDKFDRMHEREDEILGAIGVGHVFKDGRAS